MKPALWFLFCVAAGHAQIITTIAGTTWLPPVSGTSAINAPLGGPTGVAVDPSGNIYFTDALVNVVGKISPQGTLTVIGGNAKADFSGDGGPAINASLNVPHSVAVDSSGNIYIADTGNHRVREISAGIITTVAGTGAAGFSGDGGPAAGAQLSSPTAIALDAAGNLYIADLGNNRIRRISSGMITTVAGNGAYGYNADGISATSAKLANPEGIALDSAGNIYIADSGNNRIREVSNRIIQTVAGTGVAGSSGDDGPATEALLYGPNAVAVDAKGNLYISDIGNSVVREVSSGVITTVAGNGGGGPINDGAATAGAVDGVYGLTADSAGNLYIAQYSDGRIRKVSGGIITTVAGNGQGGYAGDGGPAINALLNNPARVAFDAAGALYVADLGNNRVRKISGGIITTVAGNGVAGYSGDNGLATEASLNGPWGITLDAAGNLYIADSLNQRIRKVSAGIITTVAGNGNAGFSGDGGPAANASLYAPLSAAVDASGTLYIADAGNSRVRKVSAGLISTLAGNGTTGFSGDNGPAAKASLNSPTDVAVDSAGNIYIADFGNNRIRKVSGGLIATVAGNGVSGFSGDGGAASLAEFDRPVGVAVDEAGNLYIADTDNQRIRRVTAGIVNTIVGDGDEAYYGDGGSPTAAALQFPKGLVFDAAGKLVLTLLAARRSSPKPRDKNKR